MELNKNAILQLTPPADRKVVIPGVGEFFVRVMSGTERDEWECEHYIRKDSEFTINPHNIRARLLVKTLCDKSGNRLFDDKDIDELGKVRGDVLSRLYEVAMDLNVISKADIEELTKNSEGTRSGSSSTGGRGTSGARSKNS